MDFTLQIIQILEIIIQLSMIIMVGLYFIFSNTIMLALKSLDTGAETMVKINEVILNPVFLMLFIVSGVGSLFLVLFASNLVAASGAIFFLGTTLVTMLKNVPLNNRLKETDKERMRIWRGIYLDQWVFWNHVRSIAAITSALLLIL